MPEDPAAHAPSALSTRRQRPWRTHVPAIGVLALGLLGTLAAWSLSAHHAEEDARQRFEFAATEAAHTFKDRLEGYSDLLMWGRSFVYSSNYVDRTEWREFTARGELAERYPGLLGFAYISRVAPEDLDAFLDRAREHAPDFAIREEPEGPLRLEPLGDRYIITYHEPEAVNRRAWGFDLSTKALNKATYDLAMETGVVQITDPIRFVQKNEGIHGIVMILPVYSKDADISTPHARRISLTGWVGVPIAMQSFIDAEGLTENHSLSLRISINAGGSDIELCQSADKVCPSGFMTTRSVEYGGRRFTLEAAPSSATEYAADQTAAVFVLVTGTIISALLCGVVASVSRTRVRAERIAHTMARDLVVSEERAIDLAHRADEANRAKSDFLAHMSHEIRTPMSAILGYTEMLENCPEDERPAALSTVKRNGEHLLTIINDILDISKIEARRMEVEQLRTDLPALMAETESLMRIKASARGLSLELEQATPIPAWIIADPVRLRQILVNLVGNAIKFTELGSVRLRASVRENTLCIEVIDTGIGIDEEHLAHLFEAFAQGDRSVTRRFGGTGLGLRISRSLAELMGGTLDVQSEQGVGTTFTLRLPLEGAEEAPLIHADAFQSADFTTDRKANPSSDIRLDGLRIAFAEDGPDNQRLIAHILRKAGAYVTVFDNGRLAFEALEESHGNDGWAFDLVLTDMQMPEVDGYALAGALRGIGWTAPIIALTAHAMAEDEKRCLDAGCSHFTTKPVRKGVLLETIANAISSGSSRTSARAA